MKRSAELRAEIVRLAKLALQYSREYNTPFTPYDESILGLIRARNEAIMLESGLETWEIGQFMGGN